jgi:hypothetical protein
MVTTAQVMTRLQAALAARGRRSITSAARASGIDIQMIKKWSNRLHETGSVMDSPRSGRPNVLSDQACKRLDQLVSEHPGISLRELAVKLHDAGVCDHVVSPSTIKMALERRCPKVTRQWPLYDEGLKPKQKQRRVLFAKRHARRSWKNVMFVDACKFTYARAPQHTRQGMLTYDGRRPVVKMGDDHTGLCVYGAVSFKGKSPLVFVTGSSDVKKTYKMRGDKRYTGVGAEEYINVMAAHLIPAGRKLHGDMLVYLHDWSGCHASRRVKTYQRAVGLDIMEDFPSRSPDINIIENVWAWIDSQLRKRKYNSLESFKAQLTAAWDSVPLTLLHNCVGSMKARLQAIKNAQGDRIKTAGL